MNNAESEKDVSAMSQETNSERQRRSRINRHQNRISPYYTRSVARTSRQNSSSNEVPNDSSSSPSEIREESTMANGGNSYPNHIEIDEESSTTNGNLFRIDEEMSIANKDPIESSEVSPIASGDPIENSEESSISNGVPLRNIEEPSIENGTPYGSCEELSFVNAAPLGINENYFIAEYDFTDDEPFFSLSDLTNLVPASRFDSDIEFSDNEIYESDDDLDEEDDSGDDEDEGFDDGLPKRWRGLSLKKISVMPLRLFSSADHTSCAYKESQRCNVCLEIYEIGDLLRTLPCFHWYHQVCIDKWFIKKKKCPVCRKKVSVKDID